VANRSASIALATIISQSLTADKLRDFAANIAGSFTQSTSASKLIEATVSLSSQFSLSAVNTKLVSSDVSLSGAFTPVLTVDVFRNSFAVLDSLITVTASATVTRSTTSNLTTVGSLSASITGTRLASASLASAFTQTAQGNRASRRRIPTVYSGGRYNNLTISSDQSQFGGASAKWSVDAAVNEYAYFTPFSNGSNYFIFDIAAAFVYNGTGSGNFSRNAVTGDYPVRKVRYINGQFVSAYGAYVYTSSNGISWTRTAHGIATGSFSANDITYANGLYVMVGDISTPGVGYIYTSPNLSTWTFRQGAGGIGKTVWASGSTVITAGAGMYRSTNSTTWTAITGVVPAGTWAYDIRANGTDWMMAFAPSGFSSGTGYVKTSTSDGSSGTWSSSYTLPGTSYDPTISYGNSRWFVGGCGGAQANQSWITTTDFSTYNEITFNTDIRQVYPPIYTNAGYWIGISREGLISTDGINFSSMPIEQIYDTLQPYVEFPDDEAWHTWKTIDFWYRHPADGAQLLGVFNKDILYDRAWQIQTYSNGLEVTQDSGSATLNDYDWGKSWTVGQWYHIRLSLDGTSLALYIDGQRINSGSTNTGPSVVTLAKVLDNTSNPLRIGGPSTRTYNEYFIDELLITNELKTATSTSSFTVPSAQWTNDADTQLLLHFNSNFSDDASQLPRTQTATAALTSAFTLSTSPVKNVDVAIVDAGFATVTVSVTKIINGIASLTAVASTTADVTRIKSLASDLSSAATVLVDGNILRFASSSMSSAFSQTANNSRTRDAAITTDAVFSELAAVVKIGQGLLAMDAVITALITAVKTAEAVSAQTSQFATGIDAVKTTNTSAALASNLSLSADNSRIRNAALAVASEFAESADVNVVASASITATSVATVNSVANVVTDTAVSLSSQFSQIAIGLRIQTGTVALISTATVSADGIKAVEVSAAISSAFSPVMTVNVTAGGEIVLASAFSQTAAVQRSAGLAAAVSAQSSLSASATGTIDFVIAVTSAFSQTATVLRIQTSAVLLSSSASVNADVTVIRSAESSVSAEAAVTATILRIKTSAVSTSAVASNLAAVVKIGQGLITLDSQSTLTATAQKTATVTASFASSAQLTAVNVRTRRSAVTLTAEATVFAEGTTNITGEADLTSQFTLTAQANQTATVIVITASAGTLSATALRKKSLSAALIVTGAELVLGGRITQATAALTAQSSLTGSLSYVVNATASLTGFAATVTVIDIIHIDAKLTWMIPAEDREYLIIEEDRVYSIIEENREYTLQGA
jgi:hypothetical protein